MLELLREHQLYAKKSKCEFNRNAMAFLGHVVTDRGMRMEDSKVKAILDWPALTDAKDVRSFLGLAGYYRRFVKNFSALSAPLSELLHKDVAFAWGSPQESAFRQLKAAVSAAPVLVLPKPDVPFVVTTDASGFAVGATLSQDHGDGLQPIAFMSKKLQPAEKNYPVHEQELLAIIIALKEWRHYLHGTKFRIATDHRSLQYLQTQPQLSARQVRWSEFLQQFDCNIEYVDGKSNVVADALSRRPDHLASVSTLAVTSPLLADIKSAYAADPICTAVLERKTTEPTDPSMTVKRGLIYHKLRLYVPDRTDLKTKIMRECHDAPLAAHRGISKTVELVLRNFYWPRMHREISDYVRSCVVCQSVKASNQAPAGLLQPLPIPDKKWQVISLDFIGPLKRSRQGNDSILVVVDKLTKQAHFIPCRTTQTAPELASLFMREVVRLHGVPDALVSDRDSKFTSKFWRSLWKLLGTSLNMSTAYHPQSDGQTERTNRTLEEMLRAYVDSRQSNWEDFLSAVEIAYNNSVQASTGFAPHFLNHGQDLQLPIDRLNTEKTDNPAASELLGGIKAALEIAKTNLAQAQRTQAKYADQARREVSYKVGDRVMLSTANLSYRGKTAKLLPKFVGPYPVVAVKGPNAYELKLPVTLMVHPVFNVSRLKPFVDGSHQFPERRQEDRPAPELVDDGAEVYEVEKILDSRTNLFAGRRRTEFLVKWRGYPDSDNTWEPESHLLGAHDAVQDFLTTNFVHPAHHHVPSLPPLPTPAIETHRALPALAPAGPTAIAPPARSSARSRAPSSRLLESLANS